MKNQNAAHIAGLEAYGSGFKPHQISEAVVYMVATRGAVIKTAQDKADFKGGMLQAQSSESIYCKINDC
jgi:hypothetical protein